MGQFFKSHKLPKLNQDEIDSQNNSMAIKEIKFVIYR